ncbi:MAG: hypothetical protein ACK5AZ_15405 [Bryobacteraceae bacterium]
MAGSPSGCKIAAAVKAANNAMASPIAAGRGFPGLDGDSRCNPDAAFEGARNGSLPASVRIHPVRISRKGQQFGRWLKSINVLCRKGGSIVVVRVVLSIVALFLSLILLVGGNGMLGTVWRCGWKSKELRPESRA